MYDFVKYVFTEGTENLPALPVEICDYIIFLATKPDFGKGCKFCGVLFLTIRSNPEIFMKLNFMQNKSICKDCFSN